MQFIELAQNNCIGEHINIYIYMLTNAIVLGQFNELHDVWLLDITQYKNCRLFKMYMGFLYWKSIARGVIVEDDTTRQLYRFQYQYTQVHIVTQSHVK